ncbi:hypothetical protein BTO30_11675 [Domibacillus antri]|uniref:Uncharacterized protein n=1 Tax=Domibacillus antri TaxID=1714264 RepID=A0A1Q8Q3Q0_9BACI|nr:hypothetical protein [Domibacillus antri]OLN21986.1 hypothetical protein BTO30_11675 [Domibacillus antri]
MNEDGTELYKELYYKEMERKEQINARVQIPLGLIVVLISGIFYCANSMHQVPESGRIAFLFFLSVSLISLFVAIFFINKCIFRNKFGYFPLPSEIKTYQDSLYEHYQKIKEKCDVDAETYVNQKISKFLIESYIIGTDNNIRTNDSRTKFLQKSSLAVSASVIFLVISFCFFIPDLLAGKEPTQKIEIINDKIQIEDTQLK